MSLKRPPPADAEPYRFNVDEFLALKASGAFDRYYKAELLDGELWGVFRSPDPLEQWDHRVPILLTPLDHELLRERGLFKLFAQSKLIDGEIWVVEDERAETSSPKFSV